MRCAPEDGQGAAKRRRPPRPPPPRSFGPGKRGAALLGGAGVLGAGPSCGSQTRFPESRWAQPCPARAWGWRRGKPHRGGGGLRRAPLRTYLPACLHALPASPGADLHRGNRGCPAHCSGGLFQMRVHVCACVFTADALSGPKAGGADFSIEGHADGGRQLGGSWEPGCVRALWSKPVLSQERTLYRYFPAQAVELYYSSTPPETLPRANVPSKPPLLVSRPGSF